MGYLDKLNEKAGLCYEISKLLHPELDPDDFWQAQKLEDLAVPLMDRSSSELIALRDSLVSGGSPKSSLNPAFAQALDDLEG